MTDEEYKSYLKTALKEYSIDLLRWRNEILNSKVKQLNNMVIKQMPQW